jgi:alanine dehydrogenase
MATQWISEADVVSALSLPDAIAALREAFTAEGAGDAVAMEKTMVSFSRHGTLHALGAALEGERLVGTKTWAHTPGGADPVLLLFDADDGSLLAVVEAFALGQLRTAATVALATDCLAVPDADVLAVIGTGKQALPQVAAVCGVRPVAEVRAYSRDAENRKRFASAVEAALGVSCRAADSVGDAVAGAGVITLITRATEPVLAGTMVGPGTHVNAVGAIDLERREFEPSLLGRCGMVVTDSVAQVKNLSSEFRQFYGSGPGRWSSVLSLGEVVAGGLGRHGPGELTLFKGMGSGVEDMALGYAVLRHGGLGFPVIRGGRAQPVLAREDATNRGAPTHD